MRGDLASLYSQGREAVNAYMGEGARYRSVTIPVKGKNVLILFEFKTCRLRVDFDKINLIILESKYSKCPKALESMCHVSCRANSVLHVPCGLANSLSKCTLLNIEVCFLFYISHDF